MRTRRRRTRRRKRRRIYHIAQQQHGCGRNSVLEKQSYKEAKG